MKKNILKILFINFVFFIMFFAFYNNSIADTTYEDITFTYNDVNYVVSNPALFSNDFAQKYCIFLNSNGGMSFAYSENADTTFIAYKDVNNLDKVETGGKFYYGNIIDNKWVYSGYVPTGGYYASKGILVYSNQETIYDKEGNIFYKNSPIIEPIFSIELSTTENTINPIIAYTNYYDIKYADRYEVYISANLDNTGWVLMNYELSEDTNYFRYNYKIFENGTYLFKFLDKETGEDNYLSFKITNIVQNPETLITPSNGIPVPFVSYERVGEYFLLKTQSFSLEEIRNYECFYTNSFTEDFSTWSDMGIGSLKNVQQNTTEYYFFFTVPITSENTTYYFVMYDYNKQQYSTVSSLNCNFIKMNEYSDKVQEVVKEEKNRFNELVEFFKERFGFLTYPFEFIADLLNRILNIEYEEPIIKIPKLYIPMTDNLIFSGYEYNFNTILENGAIANIYDIYLIAVDFIIILGVIVLAKNTLMEVLGNG